MVNSIFGIVSGLLMGFSKLAASYEMLIIGRLVVGFNCGKIKQKSVMIIMSICMI